MKTSNSKSQIPNKLQAPNPKTCPRWEFSRGDKAGVGARALARFTSRTASGQLFAKSVSVQWVARATSPCRWATCPAEWEGASATQPTPARPEMPLIFRRAGSPAAQAGCLCYPSQNFRACSSASDHRTTKRPKGRAPSQSWPSAFLEFEFWNLFGIWDLGFGFLAPRA